MDRRTRTYIIIRIIIRCHIIAGLLICLPLKVSKIDALRQTAWAEPVSRQALPPAATAEDHVLRSAETTSAENPEEPSAASPQSSPTTTLQGPRNQLPSDHVSSTPEQAPAGAGQQPALPEKSAGGNAEKQETIVDIVHAGISQGIQGTATWLDSFFADTRYESELNKSYVRFRYNIFKEQDAGLVTKSDVQVRIILPQLREKTHLVLSGTPKEGPADFSATQSSSQTDQMTTIEDRNVSAAVHQTVRETVKDSFIMRAGVKLHNGRPALMLGPRYRLLVPLGTWNVRFVEEAVWRSETGWESRATVDAERPLPHNLFFRAANDWVWTEHVHGYIYAFSFSVGQPLGHSRALDYEWINLFQTRPVNELTEVQLRVRYRQNLWRDWLVFEVSPQYRFPRTNRFRGLAGILFRFELVFGSYR